MSDMTSQTRITKPLPSVALDPSVLTAARESSITFVGTLFLYAARFTMGIVLARFLGAEQFGLYNLSLTVAAFAAGLALLGLQLALVRYVALFRSQRDMAGLWGTLQMCIGFPIALSMLLGIGLHFLAGPIAERLFHEPRLVPVLRLASLMVPFLTLFDLMIAAIRGFNKMKYAAIAQSIQPMLKLTLLIAVLAIAGLNAARAVAVHTLTMVAVCAMLLYFLNRLFPLRRPVRTARRDLREMLNFALPVYLSDLIGTFGGSVQTALLGALNTVTTVGLFAAASQLNTIGKMCHRSIAVASMPVVSELYGRGEREELARFYQTMTKWTFAVSLPLLLIVMLFPIPILSIFGQSFVGGAEALTILTLGTLANIGTGISGVALGMTGNTKLKLVNSIVLLVLTLGLNILLIPRWGLIGAATAASAAVVTVNLLRVLEEFILLRLLPYNVSFIKPVAAGLVALAAGLVSRRLLPTEANLVYTAMNVTILLGVYLGMILLLGLSQEDRTVLAYMGRRVRAILSK